MTRIGCLFIAAVSSAVVIGCCVVWYTSRPTFPPEIRIAAGKRDGLYHSFAQAYATRLQTRTERPVRVIETAGSEENIDLLRKGEADLALLQTTSHSSEGIVGLAPLFPEPVHLIVRRGVMINSPADLASHRVALGLEGSSMRRNAHLVLAHYGIPKDGLRETGHFSSIDKSSGVDAALVTTGWMNPLLEKILCHDDVTLIGLPDPDALAARNPWFVTVTIPRGLYSGQPAVPPDAVRTVAVTALLSARADTPDEMVRETLASLYETDLRGSYPGMQSQKSAKDYDAAAMHPAVAVYHNPALRFNRLTRALELVSKSKEAVFGAVALAVLIWGWYRRRRERLAAVADQVQKVKLEEFIGRTLAVELEQMEVSDPEQLRIFLRRVTHIKQDALQELTSEKVRGDQLFAILLAQCAALSEKIQMRMIYGRLSEDKVVT